MEYDFELRFKLPADDTDADEVVERLGEAGCDDALIGVGQPGRIALKFAREAESAKRAIVSALEDVKKAIPAAKLIEAGPDKLRGKLSGWNLAPENIRFPNNSSMVVQTNSIARAVVAMTVEPLCGLRPCK
jgi:hypothetical protein